jgi:hypothetical protein
MSNPHSRGWRVHGGDDRHPARWALFDIRVVTRRVGAVVPVIGLLRWRLLLDIHGRRLRDDRRRGSVVRVGRSPPPGFPPPKAGTDENLRTDLGVPAEMPMPNGMRFAPRIRAGTCMPRAPRLSRSMPPPRSRAASCCETRLCSRPEEEGHRQNDHRDKPLSHLASPFSGLGGRGVGLPTFLHGITCLVPHSPAHRAAETGTFRATLTDRLSYSTLARVKEFHAFSSAPLAAVPKPPSPPSCPRALVGGSPAQPTSPFWPPEDERARDRDTRLASGGHPPASRILGCPAATRAFE